MFRPLSYFPRRIIRTEVWIYDNNLSIPLVSLTKYSKYIIFPINTARYNC